MPSSESSRFSSSVSSNVAAFLSDDEEEGEADSLSESAQSKDRK